MKTDRTICLNSKVGGVQPSLQDRVYDVEGCSTAITTSFLPSIAEPMIIKEGNYSPSGHNASRIVSIQGVAPAVMENHGTITAIKEPKVINPLKGHSENGWHFEQQVYDAESVTRAVKAGGGSGNIPKVIEPTIVAMRGREPQVLTPKRTEFGKAMRKQDDSLAVMEGYNKGVCIQVGNIYPDSENMANRSGGRVYSNTCCSPTILSRDFKQPKMIMEEPKITAMRYRIRKLTPRECFRLMGVDDADIDKIQGAGISNSQQYKMAGNSIVVDTLHHLFRKMFVDTGCDDNIFQQSLF